MQSVISTMSIDVRLSVRCPDAGLTSPQLPLDAARFFYGAVTREPVMVSIYSTKLVASHLVNECSLEVKVQMSPTKIRPLPMLILSMLVLWGHLLSHASSSGCRVCFSL